jgi:hypothetical protein
MRIFRVSQKVLRAFKKQKREILRSIRSKRSSQNKSASSLHTILNLNQSFPSSLHKSILRSSQIHHRQYLTFAGRYPPHLWPLNQLLLDGLQVNIPRNTKAICIYLTPKIPQESKRRKHKNNTQSKALTQYSKDLLIDCLPTQ